MQHGGGRVITASDSLLSARPPQGFSDDDHDDDEDQNDDDLDYEIMVFMVRMMLILKNPICLVCLKLDSFFE